MDVDFILDFVIVFLNWDLMGDWELLDFLVDTSSHFFFLDSSNVKGAGSKTDTFDFSHQCNLRNAGWISCTYGIFYSCVASGNPVTMWKNIFSRTIHQNWT